MRQQEREAAGEEQCGAGGRRALTDLQPSLRPNAGVRGHEVTCVPGAAGVRGTGADTQTRRPPDGQRQGPGRENRAAGSQTLFYSSLNPAQPPKSSRRGRERQPWWRRTPPDARGRGPGELRSGTEGSGTSVCRGPRTQTTSVHTTYRKAGRQAARVAGVRRERPAGGFASKSAPGSRASLRPAAFSPFGRKGGGE